MEKDKLISANKLYKEINRIYQEHYADSAYQFIHDFFRAMLKRVRHAPAVDAVPVVRCRECRWGRERNESEARYLIDDVIICSSCEASDSGWNPVWPEHYCSYGEKRSD